MHDLLIATDFIDLSVAQEILIVVGVLLAISAAIGTSVLAARRSLVKARMDEQIVDA